MDWLDLLAVQGTLKSLLQHHSSKASILWHSAFFTVQLSHPFMTTGKTKALTRWTFVGNVMSLLLNMLSRLVITFLPRSKHLLSWLQSLSASDFGAPQNKVWHCSTVSSSDSKMFLHVLFAYYMIHFIWEKCFLIQFSDELIPFLPSSKVYFFLLLKAH